MDGAGGGARRDGVDDYRPVEANQPFHQPQTAPVVFADLDIGLIGEAVADWATTRRPTLSSVTSGLPSPRSRVFIPIGGVRRRGCCQPRRRAFPGGSGGEDLLGVGLGRRGHQRGERLRFDRFGLRGQVAADIVHRLVDGVGLNHQQIAGPGGGQRRSTALTAPWMSSICADPGAGEPFPA